MEGFKIALLLLALMVFSSCGEKSKQELYFEAFVAKYKEVELPIALRACEVNVDELKGYSGADSLFVPKNRIGGAFPYRRFKTNGDYVAVVSLVMTECFAPVLTTWTKDGRQIDEQPIAIGYCGSAPGYRCDEFMRLDKDFILYTADTISSVELDNLGHEIPGTQQNYVYYRKGRLLNSGKIELSDTIRQNLGR